MTPQSRSDRDSAGQQRQLDKIADDLYALRPDAFIAARDEQVALARAEGRPALARDLGRLRRPTQSAWLLNLLWRDQSETVEELLKIGDELRRAHARGSGSDLQKIAARRRDIEAGLLRRLRAIGSGEGVDVTANMSREAEETLTAALADAEVADELRSGRVVRPASYSGFGPILSAVPATAETRGKRAGRRRKVAAVEDEAGVDRDEQKERQQRAAAEEAVAEAREILDALTGDLAEQDNALGAADQRCNELRERLAELEEQVDTVRQELTAAERGAKVEARRMAHVQKAYDEARAELERVEAALDDR
ncbi:MAG TPA: hypothetical protein VFH02_08205 [Jiangellaceae bacterium]|nr:hypothetical protein [Jiangellaceae bacterium]